MKNQSIILTVTIAFLQVTAVFGQSTPQAPQRTTTFSIASRGTDILLGAELTGGVYPAQSMLQVQQTNGAWKPSFAQSPELVAMWDYAHRLNNDAVNQANLHVDPNWVMHESHKRAPSDPRVAASRLQSSALFARFTLGDYALLLTHQDDGRNGVAFPTPLRDIDGRFAVAKSEYRLNNLANFLVTLSPSVDPRGVSREVSRRELSHLQRFEILPIAPAIPGHKAGTRVRWLAPGEAAAPRAVVFFCNVQANGRLGYGEYLSAIEYRSRLQDSTEGRLQTLLNNAWNASTVEQQQQQWHSRYAARIAQRAAAIREQGLSDERAAMLSAGSTTPAAIHPQARMLATVDCGFGSVHYLVNPDEDPDSIGMIVDVVQLQENGRSVLAGHAQANSPQDGVIYEVLQNGAFKSALIDCLRANHPGVIAKVRRTVKADSN